MFQSLNEKELINLFKNFKVFIDTCSLLHNDASIFFLKTLPKILIDINKRIIVPKRVIDEINKHSKSKNQELRNKAKIATTILNEYQKFQIIDIKGEESDSFADNLFIAVFTKFRMKYNLCLITQDYGLSEAILDLNNKTRAVDHIKKIRIARLTTLEKDIRIYDNLKEIGKDIGKEKNKENGIYRNNESNSKKTHVQSKNTRKIKNKFQKKTINKFKTCTQIRDMKDEKLICTYLPSLNETIHTLQFGDMKLKSEIASGGEGTAFLTDKNLVAKIYKKEKLTKLRYEKLKLMVSKQVNIDGVCWPLDLVFNNQNEFIGYLMNKAEGTILELSIFKPMLLQKKFPNWNRENLINLSITILEIIKQLHFRNIIIGDLNPFNILIKNESEVYFIDTDSFQVEDYPCPVGTINYTAPEIQGKDYKSFLRTIEHENFAIATLMFMLMLPGKPPFSQQGGSNPAENIKKMNFPYPVGGNYDGLAPKGVWEFIWRNLPKIMKDAFYKTFKDNDRLSIHAWIMQFRNYLYEVKTGNLTHELYPKTLKELKNVTCSKCGKETIWKSDEYLQCNSHIFCKDCDPLYNKIVYNSKNYNSKPIHYDTNKSLKKKEKREARKTEIVKNENIDFISIGNKKTTIKYVLKDIIKTENGQIFFTEAIINANKIAIGKGHSEAESKKNAYTLALENIKNQGKRRNLKQTLNNSNNKSNNSNYYQKNNNSPKRKSFFEKLIIFFTK